MDEAYQPTWEINFCDQLFVKILPKQDNDQQQASSPHCSCLIEVSFSTTQWIVERSPNDFCYLQQKLAKYLPDNLIQLLPVGLEGINEEVLKLYENFLVSLIKHPQSWKISTLAQFLDDEKKIIYRFWASERIQELTVSSAPLSLSSDLSKEILDLHFQLLKLKVLLFSLIYAVDDNRSQSNQILDLFQQPFSDPLDFSKNFGEVFASIQRNASWNMTLPLDRLKQILVSEFSSNLDVSTMNINLMDSQQNQEILREILNIDIELGKDHFCHRQIHKFVAWIIANSSPSTEATKRRQMVIRCLQKDLFKTSLTKIFPVDDQYFLLDDNTIQLIAVMQPRDQDQWYLKANEALCACAMRQIQQGAHLAVRDIGFREGDLMGVRAIVNDFEVVFTANQIIPLYRQLLFQKINRLVGKSNLLHRSILLILIWWKRESSQYFPENVSTFSNLHLVLMTIAVFHKFGSTISEPFHALVHFFNYFRSFDWNHYALTIFGAIDIGAVSERSHLSFEPGVIPPSLLDGILRRMRALEEVYKGKSGPEIGEIKKLTPFNSPHFQPSAIVILDPLQSGYNISTSINENAAQSIQSIFVKGYTKLLQIYLLCKQSPEKCFENLTKFFKKTVDLLAVNNLTYSEESAIPPIIVPSHDEQTVMHVEFVFGSIISLDLLPKLIADLVEARGPIPIGEVGKLLAEIAGNDNLSTILKNKFRGLKRIIESFPDILVLGTEHPFNPLVHLTESYISREREYFSSLTYEAENFSKTEVARPIRVMTDASSKESSSKVTPPARNTTRNYQSVPHSMPYSHVHPPNYHNPYHLQLPYAQQMPAFMHWQSAYPNHPSEGYTSPIYLGAARSPIGAMGYQGVYPNSYSYSMVSPQNNEIAPPLPSSVNSSTSSTSSGRN